MALNLRPMKPAEGRQRVIVEEVSPQVDCGKYPTKRVLGDTVSISAAFFGDGHDHVAGRVLYRPENEKRWRVAPMTALGNDLYGAEFKLDKLGTWRFTVQAWVDHFDTWYSDLRKRIDGQPDLQHPDAVTTPQNIPLALRSGALLLEETASRAKGSDAKLLQQVVLSLRWLADQNAPHYDFPLAPEIAEVAAPVPRLSLRHEVPAGA